MAWWNVEARVELGSPGEEHVLEFTSALLDVGATDLMVTASDDSPAVDTQFFVNTVTTAEAARDSGRRLLEDAGTKSGNVIIISRCSAVSAGVPNPA